LGAALEARNAGAQVLMLEAASEDESGGMMRFTYDGVEDLRKGRPRFCFENPDCSRPRSIYRSILS